MSNARWFTRSVLGAAALFLTASSVFAEPSCTVNSGNPRRGKYYIESVGSFTCTGPVKNVRIKSQLRYKWADGWRESRPRTATFKQINGTKKGTVTAFMNPVTTTGCHTDLGRITLYYQKGNSSVGFGSDDFSNEVSIRSGGQPC